MKFLIICITFIFIIALDVHIIQTQQWTICGTVSNPGLKPSISVFNGEIAWIAGGPPDTPKIFKTLNGGLNWIQVPTAGISKELYCLWAINSTTAFVGEGNLNGNAKLFRTQNGGENWTAIFQTGNNEGFFNGIMFTRNSLNNGTGIAVAERIYKTINNGVNWTIEQSGVVGVSNAHNSLMVIDQTFYGFGMNNGAARVRLTTNSGTAWMNQTVNLTGHYTSAIAFNDNKLIGLSVTSTSMPILSRTTNCGATWTPVNIDTGVTGNCFIKWIAESPIVYILGMNGGIKRSLDNGLTWTQMTTAGVTNVYHFDFNKKENVIYGYAISTNGTVIKLVDSIIITGSSTVQTASPEEYSLEQNYPNPFNPVTTIKYSVPKNNVPVKLAVFDLLGREVAVIINEVQSTGSHEVTFDGSSLASGMYFYKLQAGTEFTGVKKMILVK